MDNKIHKIHKIKSQSDPKTVYDVTIFEDGFSTCTCPYYQFRQDCKHIKFINDKYYKK